MFCSTQAALSAAQKLAAALGDTGPSRSPINAHDAGISQLVQQSNAKQVGRFAQNIYNNNVAVGAELISAFLWMLPVTSSVGSSEGSPTRVTFLS
jgi:hypothetical protein